MYTIIIIIVTAIVSLAAFSNNNLIDNLILWPKRMDNPGQYYRLISSGFIHANFPHLIFNMLTLYFFGTMFEQVFELQGMGILYLVFYLTALIVASLPSFIKNRNNYYYRSLGASGAVAAALFGTVYFSPFASIYLMFIPIGIPSILFAVLYLIYSAYMSRRGGSYINHGAHFWGSVYGFLIAWLVDPTHTIFWRQIMEHFGLF